MLERLTIQNIALIKNQSIEFKNGLNVLTGETGAGKSLIIDSLSLLLGEKADKNLISRGERFASVEAVFSGISSKIKNIMQELGLEEDDVVIISRKISLDGKNECRVNGVSFTLSMLRKLSAPLMDLHGQFEHQNLLKVSNHLNILDLYGQKELSCTKQNFERLMSEYKDVLNNLKGYTTDDKERNRLIDLYGYQINEIDEAAFYEGEEEELKEFRNQVLHQERILEVLNTAVKLSSGDGYEYNGAVDSLKKTISMLSNISNFYKDAEDLIDRLNSLKIELDDISYDMKSKIDNMYFDDQKAIENEKRLDLLTSFKKKYGYSIEEINKYRQSIGEEYDKLINSANRVEELNFKKLKLEKEIIEVGSKLTQERKKIAENFSKEIKQELVELGMKSANFIVEFSPIEISSLNSNGLDKVEFMFTANLGEPVKPLKNVASGGEMSRFMLAIKNITAKLEGVGTLIFDEIDTGVSGHIALVLAEKLATVSKMAQVVCVTHLAQIASFGKNHYFIEKIEQDNATTTSVHELSDKARVDEIARLISGNITESSLKHADEMLQTGKNFYKNLK